LADVHVTQLRHLWHQRNAARRSARDLVAAQRARLWNGMRMSAWPCRRPHRQTICILRSNGPAQRCARGAACPRSVRH